MARHSSRRELLRLLPVEAMAIAVVVASATVVGTLGNDNAAVAWILPILLAPILVLVLFQRAVAVRTIPTRIAIGGAQGVGKTVYTNVVTNRLAESASATLSFTLEAKTAQHVYRVLGALRRKQWPESTRRDDIDRYRGTMQLLAQSLPSQLVRGRIEFEVEIADSAGELWEEMTDSREQPSRLLDSSFFEYVGESTAMLYFIPADALQEDPQRVADQVDDLLSTVQVLRSIEPRGVPELLKPIGLVISKADLLHPVELDALSEVFGARAAVAGIPRIGTPFFESLERIEHLAVVMNRQARSFQGFVVSALNATRSTPGTFDPLAEVEAPVEWVLREVLSS